MTAQLAQYWNSIQQCLFPGFEIEVGKTTNKHQEVMIVLDMLYFERFIYDPVFPSSRGRPPISRVAWRKRSQPKLS